MQDFAHPFQAHSGDIHQRANQLQARDVAFVVMRPGGAHRFAMIQEPLAEVVLDRRDRHAAALGKFRNPHGTILTLDSSLANTGYFTIQLRGSRCPMNRESWPEYCCWHW